MVLEASRSRCRHTPSTHFPLKAGHPPQHVEHTPPQFWGLHAAIPIQTCPHDRTVITPCRLMPMRASRPIRGALQRSCRKGRTCLTLNPEGTSMLATGRARQGDPGARGRAAALLLHRHYVLDSKP